MKRAIFTTTIISALTGAMVVVLCACTSMQSSEGVGHAQKKHQEPPVFRGKIITPQVDSESRYLMGCVYQERKKHHLAIVEFKSVLERNPMNVAAYNRLGVSLDALRDYEGAVEAYSTALEIDPNLAHVYNNLGYSYLLQGRPDLAVVYFKKAVALDGDNPQYHNNLGLAYAESEQYDAALAAFKDAGDDAQAHENLARFYYRNGLYDKADIHFAWASVLNPSSAGHEKARMASARMSEIHADTEKQPDQGESPPKKQARKMVAAIDDGGFTTIPAGAIEHQQDVTIDQIIMAVNRHGAIIEDRGRSVDTTILDTVAFSESDRVAARPTSTAVASETTAVTPPIEVLSLTATDSQEKFDHRLTIEVSNGNGVNGMARTVGNYLRLHGPTTYRLTNADHFNYPKTLIYYREGFQDQAYKLESLLPGLADTDHLVAARTAREAIRVLVGHDLVASFNDQLKHEFNVDLTNGNGVNGMARRLGKHLVREGFRVGRLTNADHFEYKRTIVFYNKGQSDHARMVAEALPGNPESRFVEVDNPGDRVQVVLGADMAI